MLTGAVIPMITPPTVYPPQREAWGLDLLTGAVIPMNLRLLRTLIEGGLGSARRISGGTERKEDRPAKLQRAHKLKNNLSWLLD